MREWVPRVMSLHRLAMDDAGKSGELAFSFGGRRPNRDSLTQSALEEFVFFVGAPPHGGAAAAEAPEAGSPLPASLEDCRRELGSTRERAARRLAQLAGFQPASALHAQAASTPALTRSMTAVAEAAFRPAHVRVDCRARICRLEFDGPPPSDAVDRLNHVAIGDEANLRSLREHDFKTQKLGNNLYVTIPSESAYGFLRRVRRPMREAAFWQDCPAPEREGNVLVRIVVPASGEPNEDGAYRRVSAKAIGGTLAGTASATCLSTHFAALLADQELPDPIGNLMRFESWTWAPGGTPTMVTAPGL
jgi:hypothetical protein